jgi:hypothetical protein
VLETGRTTRDAGKATDVGSDRQRGWALPEDPLPQESELSDELRRGWFDEAGLSLDTIAHRTTSYSKPAWHRVFNGSALPSREALAELCAQRSLGADRLLHMWDQAYAARLSRTTAAPSPQTGTNVPPAVGAGTT